MNHPAIIEPEPLDELFNGELGLTTVRPVPRSEEWYRAQAEDYYRDMPESGIKRVYIADWIAYAKLTDKSLCANSRRTI